MNLVESPQAENRAEGEDTIHGSADFLQSCRHTDTQTLPAFNMTISVQCTQKFIEVILVMTLDDIKSELQSEAW